MEKINFENLPSTNTPLSAENLNQMQDNMENAIPIIDTGTEDFATINGYVDKEVTFNKTFSSQPMVLLTIQTATTNTNYEHITCMCHSLSTTGFTIRVTSSFANLYPTIRWVAIGS